MKLLLTNFHEYGGGGHDTYIYELANALSKNHSITVAAPATSRLFEKISHLEKVKLFSIKFQIKLNALKTVFQFVRALRCLLVQENYDVIHVNGSGDHTMVLLATLFMKSRPKIVFTKHNSLPIKWGAKCRYRYGTDIIIAVSKSTQKMFDQKIQTPIKVIPNGIDTQVFYPTDLQQSLLLRETYGLYPHNFVIGSVAGTALYKGWGLLLQAVAEIRNELPDETKIVIVGDLPSEDLIETYVRKPGLAEMVIFTGWISDVRQVIPVFDVGFVLSYGIETISFACRQMMAMGKPVMVSDYAGLPENVTNDVDGWITKCGDIEDIKRCLLTIVANREKLPFMSLKAREKAVNQFSHAQWVADTLNVYEAVI